MAGGPSAIAARPAAPAGSSLRIKFVTARRWLLSGGLAAAGFLPAVFWLWPALAHGQAPSFRDQGDFFYPLKLYTAGRIREGAIPFWNPLSGTGEPWLANLQSGVFYPPTFFFLLRSPALAAALFLLFHFGLAAWGMRRFLLEEAVSEAGALVGTAVYCAGGLAVSLSAYWNHFGGWAYLPAILGLARSGLTSRPARVGLAFLVGLQAMAGSPELSGATLAAALLFAFVPRSNPEEPWAPTTPRRGASRLALAGLLGLALAGWALVPAGELWWHSDRRAALSQPDREGGAAGTKAVTSALGLSSENATSYLSTLYFGPAALFAAAAAFSEKQRRNLLRVVALMGLVGILAAAAGPPGTWLRQLPPLDRVRYPSKALVWTSFAVAALAGLGADRLRFAGDAGRRWRIVLGAAGAAALVLCAAARQPLPVRALSAAAAAAFLALGQGAGRLRIGGALAGIGALALTAALALAGAPAFAFVPEAEIRREPAEVAPLSRVPGRILTPPGEELALRAIARGVFNPQSLRAQRESLVGYTNLLFGISTVRTAAALPTVGARTIADTIDSADDPVRAAAPASARVLWTPFRPASLPSHKVGEYYRVPLAPYRSRLSFVRTFRVEPDAASAWRRAAGGQIDLDGGVFLDRPPGISLAGVSSRPLLVAHVAEDSPERVVAEVTTNGPGLLVLTDLFYPGWIAEVDKARADLLRADGFFRAVALGGGTHRVVFRYMPISFYAGAGLSAVAAAFLVLRLLLAGRDDARSLL